MKTLRCMVPLVFFLFIAGFSGAGQENKPTVLPDEKPVFPGGEEALKNYLTENIVYPAEAKENGIAGKVFVSFTVGKDGKVIETELVKGVETLLDKEALRVVGNMPDWKPGKKNGVPMDVRYTIPVQFQLEPKIKE